MSDLKSMRRRADLAVREGANVVLLPEQYAALIACAEALQESDKYLSPHGEDTPNQISSGSILHRVWRNALAQLEAAP